MQIAHFQDEEKEPEKDDECLIVGDVDLTVKGSAHQHEDAGQVSVQASPPL